MGPLESALGDRVTDTDHLQKALAMTRAMLGEAEHKASDAEAPAQLPPKRIKSCV